VALHTQAALATAMQKMLEHGSGISVMAAQTVQRSLITRIENFLPLRMSKIGMQIMALITDIPSVLQHRRVIPAMS
jgi:hypothetical protein